jgi:hypothetical protein
MRKLIAAIILGGCLAATLATVALADSGWGSGSLATAGGTEPSVAAEVSARPTGEDLGCCAEWPDACMIGEVSLSITCCGCDCEPGTADNIVVTFYDHEWKLLAISTLKGPWCSCRPCDYSGDHAKKGKLDKPVDPSQVCHIRISKPGDDNLQISYLKLKVGSAPGECECPRAKWYTIVKCDVCCTDINAEQAWIVNSDCCAGEH